MHIAMIGGGYVGLVSGACFAEFGNDVAVVEADAAKLAALRDGRMPIFEPGLDRLVAENVAAGRLSFGEDIAAAVAGAEAVFIAVGTPSRRGDGHADLSFVYAAAEQVAHALQGYAVIVTKSTVPVGTGRRIAEIVREARPDLDFDVASNPEFLREGSAIGDFMRPDRVVIGAEGERAREVMRRLYRPLYLIEAPIQFTAIETAELIKYAANSFLAMKVTFINEMADLCERLGADVHDVARGIGLDGRIGRKFLHPGPGFGGSCFPKDTLALVRIAQDAGAPSRLVETVVAVNDARKAGMAARIVAAAGGSVRGRTVGVLGLTFKPETDDMRDSPAVPIVARLVEDGATVRAFDPEGMEQARPLLPGGRALLPRRAGCGFGGGCAGGGDRVERVPRAGAGAAEGSDARRGGGRSAQHLRTGGDGGGRLRLPRHRPGRRGGSVRGDQTNKKFLLLFSKRSACSFLKKKNQKTFIRFLVCWRIDYGDFGFFFGAFFFAGTAAGASRPARWYSRFGIMSVAAAMRLDRLNSAVVSAMSKISSLENPCARSAARSASATSCSATVSLWAKSSMARWRGGSAATR